jgi:hypothetical protein
MKRIFVYGDEYNDVFEKNKKEWKGRYYKNLHKKGSGWSFPDSNQSIITFNQIIGSLKTYEEDNEIIIEENEIKQKDGFSQTEEIMNTKDGFSQTKEIIKQKYIYDVPKEIKLFFKEFI